VTLALWIISGLFFAIVLNWTISARVIFDRSGGVILLVRRMGDSNL